jgi:hypothetical protein
MRLLPVALARTSIHSAVVTGRTRASPYSAWGETAPRARRASESGRRRCPRGRLRARLRRYYRLDAMTDSAARINWEKLAEELGTLERTSDEGRIERGSSDLARRALELIVSPASISATVDDYVSGAPGAELARSVLWLLRPPSAMARCWEIYRCETEIWKRRSAVELLRVVADERVLPWIATFLKDEDAEIQSWGIGVLDQLAFSKGIDREQCAAILEQARLHQNSQVRTKAEEIAASFITQHG